MMLKKLPLSAKIKHIVEAKTKASKIRFVVKIYITRKIAGINAKKPIDWPSAIELDEGKKAVNKNVKPIKRIQVIQKPKMLFLKLCCPNLPFNDFLQISIYFRVTPFYILSKFLWQTFLEMLKTNKKNNNNTFFKYFGRSQL